MPMTSIPTSDLALDPPATGSHAFFAYIDDTPDKAIVRELAVQLANYYFRCNYSRTRWTKEAKRTCRWRTRIRNSDGTLTATERTSPPYQLSDIERHLSTTSTLRFDELGLPNPMCHWLDSSIMMAPAFHAPTKNAEHAMTFCAEPNLGPRFPLVPTLDREGTAHTSFQSILLNRIGGLRSRLVATSTELASDDWFQDFRTLVTESAALIENTLHQVYFKAQYAPPPGWKFDPTALGGRYGGRAKDKIKWVYKITGEELQANAETNAYVLVKGLRNHLQHFDPPSFAYTWEEMADWLNAVLGVARLAWKIRVCLGASPSVPLINLLLQRRVKFSPKDPGRQRLPRPRYVGYASTAESALASGERPKFPFQPIWFAAPPEIEIR